MTDSPWKRLEQASMFESSDGNFVAVRVSDIRAILDYAHHSIGLHKKTDEFHAAYEKLMALNVKPGASHD